MKIEMKFTFRSMDELNTWYENHCWRCAMANKDNGRNDPCEVCKWERIYKEWLKKFGKNGDDED